MSEEINRYTIVDSGNPSKVWNSTFGGWVKYKDHAAFLESERLKSEKLRVALIETNNSMEALIRCLTDLTLQEAVITNITANEEALKETEVK